MTIFVPNTVARERRNGGDVDEYRKQLHNLGPRARADSKDKRATFRGEFTPTPGERPNRAQRRKLAALRRSSQ